MDCTWWLVHVHFVYALIYVFVLCKDVKFNMTNKTFFVFNCCNNILHQLCEFDFAVTIILGK